MPDPRLDAVRQQMLQEGFPPDEVARALRDVSALTQQQSGDSPSFFQRFMQTPVATGGAASAARGLVGGQAPLSELTPAERTQAQSPLTAAEAGRLALPFLVNRLIPAGRTFSRIGGQILGNVLGSAALEGGQAAVKGEEVLPATIEGAVKGVPSGILQGATAGIFGPNRATLKATAGTKGLAQAFSEDVGKLLSERFAKNPKALFTGETAAALQRAAGKPLDAMEAALSQQLKGERFQFAPGTGPKSLLVTPGGRLAGPAGNIPFKVSFEEIREEIKRLRNIGEDAFENPERQFKAKQRAARIEHAFLDQLEAGGHQQEATLYRETIQRFAQDRGILRAVKAVQRAQSLPGGLNRADSPIVAAAVETLQDSELSASGRAAAMSALALSGHPFMALHFARFGRGTGFVDPNKVRSPLGGRSGGLLGAVAGTLGAAGTTLATPTEAGESFGSITEHRKQIEKAQQETAPPRTPAGTPPHESAAARTQRLLDQIQRGGQPLTPEDFKFLQEQLK